MKVIGVTGYKNAGKTGLVERLVAELVGRGLRVSTLKHAHHDARIDTPGTDSDRHRAAGARQVALVAGRRWAVMTELDEGEAEPSLADMLARLDPADLVVVEGWKALPFPKIEVWREGLGHPLRAPDDPSVVAVAAKGAVPPCPCPVLDLDDTRALADLAQSAARPVHEL